MSAVPAKTADPSMEEILASIRRIIADDDDKAPRTEGRAVEPEESVEAPQHASAAPPPAAAPVPPSALDDEDEPDDVLDLAAFEDRVKSDTSLEIDLPDLSFQATAPLQQEVEAPPVAKEPEAVELKAVPEPPQPTLVREMPAIPREVPALPAVESAPGPSAPFQQASSHYAPEPVAKPIAAEPAPKVPEAMLSQESSASVGQAFNLLSHTIMSQNQNTLEDLVREMLKPMLKTWLDDNLPPLVERLVTAEIQRVARGQR